MQVANTTPYTDGLGVTISGVLGDNANTILNGQMFYVAVSVDFPSSGNVSLYVDQSRTVPVDGTGLTYTNSPNAIATSLLAGAGGSGAGGSNSSVQFNSSGLFLGDSGFTFNNTGIKLLTVTGNINTGNLHTTGSASVGPLLVTGDITPSANITYNLGNNTNRFNELYLAGSTIHIGDQTISANATSVVISGSIVGNMSGNATTAGTVTTAAQPNVTSVGTLTSLAVTGTATAGNLSTGGTLNVTGNANVGNIQGTTGYFSTISNPVTTGNVLSILGSNSTVTNAVGGGITLTAGRGNTAGSGGAVRINGGAVAGTTNAAGGLIWLTAGTSYGAPAGGGVTIQAGGSTGTGSRLTLAGGGGDVDPRGGGVELVAGASLTGTDIRGSNLTIKGGSGTGAGQPGNILFQTSNFLDSGTTPQTPSTILTVSSLGILVAGNIGVTDITSGSVDTVGNITGNWSLTAGSHLNATYADLAECYKADAYYEAGTVLEFGGTNEVTLASDSTNRVAGVVSTNPAYVMNSQCEGEHIIQLALQGRAPCKVRGNVRKGDMMVSGGDGFARPSASPLMGTVIGKSLEDFTGTSGVIEVAVGRL